MRSSRNAAIEAQTGIVHSNGRRFRLNKETSCAIRPKAIIRRLCPPFDTHGIFVNHVLKSHSLALTVSHVPAKKLKKWISDIQP